MIEYLIEKDKWLLVFINSSGSASYDDFWLFISHKFSALPLYLLLLFLCIKFFGWKKTGWILLGIALMILTTDQVANLFKHGFERLRPCHDPSLVGQMRMVICGGKYGYFSAHAANAMALGVFFNYLFFNKLRWLSPTLFFWVLLVSYSRIYLGVHFPGDVLTGLFIGGFFGFFYGKIVKRILKKYE